MLSLYKYKTEAILRGSFIFLLSLLLFACAGGQIKQATDDADAIALREMSGLVELDPAVEVDFNKAVALMKQEKNAQAIEILKTVIEREQRLPAPFVNIALAYNRIGESAMAEENLLKALTLDMGNAIANNELGLLYRKQGKFDAARMAYQKAIDNNPEYLPAKRNLGVLCDLYLRDFECALEQFEAYLYLQAEDKTMAIWVADVKLRLKNSE